MKKTRKETLIWGIILIIIGLIFLFPNFNIGIWNTIVNLWPLILIGWGIWKLYLGIVERREAQE